MDIQNNNVAIQIAAKDRAGKTLRVRDCDVFVMHIFTDNPRFYLTFSKRDICQHRGYDELVIPKHQMEQLQSGVVQYTYHYLPVAHDCKFERGGGGARMYAAPEFGDENVDTDPVDDEFGGFDETGDAGFNVDKVNDEGCYRPHHRHEQLIHSKAVVTSIYWRNIAHPHPVRPMNAVTLTDIERLHRLIEREKINREKDVEKLEATFGEGFSDKLDAEIERSTAEDEKFAGELDALKNKLSDFSGSVGDNQSKVDTDIKANTEDLKAEVVRATAKEIELEQMIQGEVSRAKSVEEVIDTKIVMEKERATSNEQNINDRLVSLTDRFDAYKELNTETVKSEIERAKATESALNDKIQGVVNDLQSEVSRAAEKDIEHTNLVTTESNRAQAVENKIATDLETEIGRAKDAEKHLLDEVHGVQDVVSNLATATNVYTKVEVDKKVSDVRNDVSTLENWVANHTDNTDELKAKVTALSTDVDKAKADILAEVAKCDAENDKLATEIQTLKDSTYTKAEVDSTVSDINSSVAALENWKANHNDNTDELKAKVAQLVADTEKLNIDLANETNARENADLTIQAKADVVEGKVDAEVVRAKAVEKTLEDALADEASRAKAAEIVNAGNISDIEANLTLEVARAKAAEKVLEDAIDVVNGDVATAGSIKKSLADAKDYTDAEITKAKLANDSALADTLKSYATNDAVDKKIADVVGTAPEALDTLGKISNALASDSDAITAINGVLSGKANSEDVYTKSEIDTTVTGINNSISTLETKVDNADATLNSRIDDLNTKLTNIELTSADDASAFMANLAGEINRAKAAEKSNSDKIDAEIEKLNNKYNELNATVIADIAESTAKDVELEAKINVNEAAISSEVARAKQVETVTAH